MSDKGRIVPPHASGGGSNLCRPLYVYRNPYRNDPDETEGRRLYRARAEAEARRQLAYDRHKVRLVDDAPLARIEASGHDRETGRDAEGTKAGNSSNPNHHPTRKG